MPIRFRITLLFSVVVFVILGILCVGIYYFSFKARERTIKTRLANRALTTARLLSQREIFDQSLVRKIDSFTTIALKNKIVEAFDFQNNRIYSYTDLPGDTLHVDEDILNEARVNGEYYFILGSKEAVAYHYKTPTSRMVVVSAAEDVDGRANLNTLKRILLLTFLTGNLLVLVGGYFFSGGLVLPIKKISENVAEISAQNLTRRIQTGSSKDEWNQLSTTFNDLLDRLQESFELQQRFIANASHELSTPLTSISSQLEVAMLRKRDADDYLKVMQSIYQDVQHMSKLTQTLLEFAKASGSKGGIEIDLIRMDEVVLRLPSEVVKNNPKFQVKLEFEDLPEDEQKLLVFGNEALLFTAIRNIVTNACKYSADSTAIVKLKVTAAQILIFIQDHGSGIPEAELTNIFQPFYRVDGNVQASGFGLGLSLAERIIKLHKGFIKVQSIVGEGTTFGITLPAAANLKGL
jgi:two-component system sensor histidine kinase ArlS